METKGSTEHVDFPGDNMPRDKHDHNMLSDELSMLAAQSVGVLTSSDRH